jgi:hypothetical protein
MSQFESTSSKLCLRKSSLYFSDRLVTSVPTWRFLSRSERHRRPIPRKLRPFSHSLRKLIVGPVSSTLEAALVSVSMVHKIDNAINLGLATITWEFYEVQSCLKAEWLLMTYPSMNSPQIMDIAGAVTPKPHLDLIFSKTAPTSIKCHSKYGGGFYATPINLCCSE